MSTTSRYIDKYLISVGGGETILCQEVTPSDVSCYICQQDTYQGVTTDRLVRDCSCRGDSGYAHTRCIVESAITHSNNNSGDWLQCRKGWTECPNCNEGYKNQLGLDLSFRFIGYLKSKSASIEHLIYARTLTLRIITDMYAKIPHNPRYNRLGTKAVQDITHSMNELKENDMSMQSFIFAKAAVCYNAGQLALIEGTEQSMHIAKGNFMACLELVKLIGLVENDEGCVIKFASRGLNAANDFLNSISKATDDDNINSLLQELAIGNANKSDGDSMDLVTGRYRGSITSIEANNIKSDHGTLDSINKEWERADKEDILLVNDSSKINPKKRRVESNDSANTSQDDTTTTNPTTNAHAPPRDEDNVMDIDAPTSSQDLDTPGFATSNTTAKEEVPETNVIMSTNPPSINSTAEELVDYCMEVVDCDTLTVLKLSSQPTSELSSQPLPDDSECTSTSSEEDDNSEEDYESYCTDTDDESSLESSLSYDSDQNSVSYDYDSDTDTGDDGLVADDPLGGWNGCGRTKMMLFAQSVQESNSMTDVDDTSPFATERLGDIFQSQYAKVKDALKKYNALKSDNSPEFINTPEFKTICEETARLIKREFPGYDGDLCDFVEIFLLGRVSPGTEHLNTGKTQGARMLVDAKLREEKKHFNHQVLLHPKFFLEIAHDRRLIEECPSLHEVIKAVLYSSSKENHLFVNDSLRAFYEPIQHRFLLEVLKAINPNKVIVIRLCQNGLMSPDKNEEVIQLVNTRESGLSALRKELSHVSPSENVPITKSEDPKQADIDKRANERRAEWIAANRYSDEVRNAFKAGQEYTPSKRNGPKFRKMVENVKSKLQLDVPEPPLYYDKSITEKGSRTVHNGHVNYFGRQTGDDIAALIRTSSKTSKAKVDKDGMPVECIASVASIVACIELRKEQGLLSKKTKLKYIIYGRHRSRSSIVSDHDNKLLDVILTNEIGHVITTSPNRINEDPIVVQTYVGPVEFHCSKESGKEIGPILRNEEERNCRHQVITNTCKTAVVAVENDCDDVRSDSSFHKLLKKVSKAKIPKEFAKLAEEYSTTSYVPLSSIDSQHQKQLEVCNDEAKKYLELNPKPKKKAKKEQGSNNLVCSKCGISRSREYFNCNERKRGDGDRQCRTCLNSSMQQDALTKKRAEAKKRLENEDDGGTCPYCVGLPACTVWCPSKYTRTW